MQTRTNALITRRALLIAADENGGGYATLCRHALATAGFTVFSASSPAGALKLCHPATPFELLVTDIALTDGNSREGLLPILRALYPSIKVLVLSETNLCELLAAGVLPPEEFHPGRTVFLRQPQPEAVLMGKLLSLFDTPVRKPATRVRRAPRTVAARAPRALAAGASVA